jgi:hypothetical protein
MGHVPVIAGLRYVSVRLPSLASMVCYLLNQLVRQRGLGKRRACLVVQNKLRLATAVADNSPKVSATAQPRHRADSQSHSSDSLLRLNALVVPSITETLSQPTQPRSGADPAQAPTTPRRDPRLRALLLFTHVFSSVSGVLVRGWDSPPPPGLFSGRDERMRSH